jgi:tyrosyl-DNA phosphodiesterase-1
MEPPSKKSKVSSESDESSVPLASLHREISPPLRSRQPVPSPARPAPRDQDSKGPGARDDLPKIISSPIQLTNIRDLPPANNVDTVRLRDILGDPMIRECWQFNYLFDVDFLLSNFDEDVRNLVKVKVVHGSWQKEAPNRIRVEVSFSVLNSMGSIKLIYD